MYQTFETIVNGKTHHFVFDPETDDPSEGATLTLVADKNGKRLPPSVHAEARAWQEANEYFRLA